MTDTNIYRDIAARTDGAFMLGVVGPVRTGKSTFIKRFMETLVIPRIDNTYMKERARDELPQSGSGRTIMTAEPKFVPENAVNIALGDGAELSVRLVDCVGYMVDGAAGQFEDGAERLVTTPWFDHEITLTEAAEKGTHKVITEHSTVGIVVTTDGTICDIPREKYCSPPKQRRARVGDGDSHCRGDNRAVRRALHQGQLHDTDGGRHRRYHPFRARRVPAQIHRHLSA